MKGPMMSIARTRGHESIADLSSGETTFIHLVAFDATKGRLLSFTRGFAGPSSQAQDVERRPITRHRPLSHI